MYSKENFVLVYRKYSDLIVNLLLLGFTLDLLLENADVLRFLTLLHTESPLYAHIYTVLPRHSIIMPTIGIHNQE